jgi:hypothetical protein
VARVVSRAAAGLSGGRVGALIVIERETGLQDAAETGVMLNADLSDELLATLFAPHAPLHDGAVIIRGEQVFAAAAVLPLSETSLTRERYGTRHRAAIGITEQTDAVAVVVSEETGMISLVQRGRVLRDLDEERLRTALVALLRPPEGRGRAAAGISVLGLAHGKRVRGRRRDRRTPETATPAAQPPVVGSPPPPATSAIRPAPTRPPSGALAVTDPAVPRSAGGME